MKRFIVKAYNGIGKDKVFVGEKEIDQPETLEECKLCEAGADDPEKEVVGHYWSSKVIDEQRKLRAKTADNAKTQLAEAIRIAKTQLDAGDSKLADLLKAAKVKLPWENVEEKKDEPKQDEAKKDEAPPAPPPDKKEEEGEKQISPNVRRRRAAKK
jgi:hypothetical protein